MADEAAEEQVVQLTPEEAKEVAAYDITRKITPHLDRHMVLPILDYLRQTCVFAEADMLRAEIDLLMETSLIDVVKEKYELLGEECPDLDAKSEEILQQLHDSHQKVLPLLQIFEDPGQLEQLQQLKSLNDVCREFKLETSIFDELFKYTRLKFDSGDYPVCGIVLRHWQSMMAQDQEQLPTWRTAACSWGLLACELCMPSKNEQALESFQKLDEYLETARMGKREVLLQRTWLLHWALFGIFRCVGDGKVLDLFMSEKSMMVMAVACPHLFRYVAASLVLKKRLKHTIKDAVRVINMESSSHSDPVTRFLCALYVDVDFDEAQRELKECGKVFTGDFFLAPHWPEFEENARLLIFETYCRIHQCINIAMIASKLNMEAPEAELWIVKLIQNAKLDARIDSEKSRVVMTKAPPSVYQQVIDKTKDLSFRSTMLLSHLEKREQEKAEAIATGNKF